MHRAVLLACWPWLALLAASVVCVTVLVRASGARPRFGQFVTLHRDEAGGVQSLSFVLTLPIFVMFLLFIVQVSQLLIGTMVVNYAAFASARAAIVWIPADFGPGLERDNCISTITPTAADDFNFDGDSGLSYSIRPGGAKYEKIQLAAALACAPIAPSRDLGLGRGDPRNASAPVLNTVYQSLVPGAQRNNRIPRRIENKLAYSLENTSVDVRFLHKSDEPPIASYYIDDDPNEFYDNEVGWQDPISVTVTHNFALMPGPGRLLARPAESPGQRDDVSRKVQQKNRVYVYPIRATATLTNEGEKPLLPYVHRAF